MAEQSIFERVRNEVDLRLAYDFTEEERDFGDYTRDLCPHPDHLETAPSFLVFADGGYCTACGWRGDAVSTYQLLHPGLRPRDAALALLSGDFQRREEGRQKRERTKLNPDLATRAHLELAKAPAFIRRLERMGFSRQTIWKHKLGLAEVGVLVSEPRADPEYEQQLRFAVPIWGRGHTLKQVVYRRIDDLYERGPKTQLETGAGSHLFGIEELAGADAAFVVEGWGDKLIGEQLAHTLPQFKKVAFVTSTNGAGHWNDSWTEHLTAVRTVFVLGDADSAGQKLVARVRRRVLWALPLPPLGPIGSKFDLRDWFLAGGRDLGPLVRRAQIEAAKRKLEEKYGATPHAE